MPIKNHGRGSNGVNNYEAKKTPFFYVWLVWRWSKDARKDFPQVRSVFLVDFSIHNFFLNISGQQIFSPRLSTYDNRYLCTVKKQSGKWIIHVRLIKLRPLPPPVRSACPPAAAAAASGTRARTATATVRAAAAAPRWGPCTTFRGVHLLGLDGPVRCCGRLCACG